MNESNDGNVSDREIKNLKNLASRNFGKFAVAVQHMSAEVQMKIIEQLPEFRKLATGAVESVGKNFEITLLVNQEGEDKVHQGFSEWRAALIAMLEQPDLSLEDKLRITAEIGETVHAQARKDAQDKAFKAELFMKATLGAVAVVGLIVVSVVGGRFGSDLTDNNES